MTEITNPGVTITLGSAGGSQISGPTGIVTPVPPDPINIVDDSYWDSWTSAEGPMVWDEEAQYWTTNVVPGQVTYGLQPRTTGPNANWASGFRANKIILHLNSAEGPNVPTSLSNNTVELYNTFGTVIADDTLFDFTSYEQEKILVLDIDNTNDLDYRNIRIATFLQNSGPWVSLIEFIQ